MLSDSFGRDHDYLRISLTDRCNLRCFYCMPEEDHPSMAADHLLTADEIERIARTFVEHGVKKIRLTGGEPLVRKDAAEIFRALSRLGVELALTTNGILLGRYFDVLRETGIRSVNVSLDTLCPEKFKQITRRDHFATVLANILRLVREGFRTKVNVVVTRGVNDGEIADFVRWTKELPVNVRFIEFMPFTGNRWQSTGVFAWREILASVESEFIVRATPGAPNDTAKNYEIEGHVGTLSVISTMSAPFCSTCNRIRLTADGKLKNCLFSKSETDLVGALRRGEAIAPLIAANLRSKAKELGGQFDSGEGYAGFAGLRAETIENRSMIAIGG